jgi:hypothetical protein
MDHNEAVRKFEQLMIREADHAHAAATELEALVSLLRNKLLSGESNGFKR